MQIKVQGSLDGLASAAVRVPPGSLTHAILAVRLVSSPYRVRVVQDTDTDSHGLVLDWGSNTQLLHVLPVGETAAERWLLANSDHFLQQGAGFVQICYVPRDGALQEVASVTATRRS